MCDEEARCRLSEVSSHVDSIVESTSHLYEEGIKEIKVIKTKVDHEFVRKEMED